MGAPQLIDQNVATGTPVGTLGGTTNTIPRWTGPTTLGDSLITQTLAGAPFEATRIRVATGVDTYAWFRDSVPSGNVLFVAANAAFGMYKGLEIASAGTYFTFGNVGIGTTSPSTRLHVSDNSSIPVIVQSSGSTDSYLRFINTANNFGYIGYIGTNLYLAPNNGTGNVGIGTASPNTRLQVNDGSFPGVSTATQRNIYTGTITAGYGGSIGFGGYYTGTTETTFAFIVGGKDNATAGDYAGHLQFWTRPNGGSYAERARIDSTGNLILNTANTGATIQAAGTGQGLKLPATPGNADTQTLDCYAEGTWTPTLAGFVTNTPGSIAASYTRVGRMVTLNVYLYAGGSSFGSTLGTTTVTVPSGMTPNFDGVGIGGLSRTTSSTAQAIAYYDGKIYLGTSASAATEMWVSVTYYV